MLPYLRTFGDSPPDIRLLWIKHHSSYFGPLMFAIRGYWSWFLSCFRDWFVYSLMKLRFWNLKIKSPPLFHISGEMLSAQVEIISAPGTLFLWSKSVSPDLAQIQREGKDSQEARQRLQLRSSTAVTAACSGHVQVIQVLLSSIRSLFLLWKSSMTPIWLWGVSGEDRDERIYGRWLLEGVVCKLLEEFWSQ